MRKGDESGIRLLRKQTTWRYATLLPNQLRDWQRVHQNCSEWGLDDRDSIRRQSSIARESDVRQSIKREYPLCTWMVGSFTAYLLRWSVSRSAIKARSLSMRSFSVRLCCKIRMSPTRKNLIPIMLIRCCLMRMITASYLIMHMVPPYESIPKSQLHSNLLPPKADGLPSHTLVLDLDETLVHCYLDKPDRFDISFQVFSIAALECRSATGRSMKCTFALDRMCFTFWKQWVSIMSLSCLRLELNPTRKWSASYSIAIRNWSSTAFRAKTASLWTTVCISRTSVPSIAILSSSPLPFMRRLPRSFLIIHPTRLRSMWITVSRLIRGTRIVVIRKC